MRFTSDRTELRHALDLVRKVADAKATVPILANVRLTVGGNAHVTIEATDLIVAATVDVPATCERPGTWTLDARKAQEVVKGGAGPCTADYDGNGHCTISSASGSSATMGGLPSVDFPVLPSDAGLDYSPFPAAALRSMIGSTYPCITTDESRYHLSGALFECDGESARMVATDGHRLCRVESPVDSGPVLKRGVLIPRHGLDIIARVLKGHKAPMVDLGIDADGGMMFVRADNVTLAIKLVDAQFPPYEMVIPKDKPDVVLVFDSRELRGAIKRLGALTADRVKAIKLIRDGFGWALESDEPDMGTATEKPTVIEAHYDVRMSTDKYKDTKHRERPINPEYKIGFNGPYMIDALESIADGTVRLSLRGELDPLLLCGEYDTATTCVVMPMRV